MPTATTANDDRNVADQKMWNALKRYILRDRQRKKEEYEAKVEEEKLRKEREARERQDVMTLEETKEQIDQLEQKIKQLEKEKQQLFMQLKKVLNEDEFRKRHKIKEFSEQQSMKMPMNNSQMQMFGQGGEPPPSQGRPPPLTSHLINKSPIVQRGQGQSGVKRQRSPSPTYPIYQQHRLHQQPMKHQNVYSDHKLDDNRMGGRPMARAVLWNKPSQYASNVTSVSSSPYYAMPNSNVVSVVERPPPLLYAHHGHAPHGGHAPHTPHTPHSSHHANLLYAPAQSQLYHLDMINNREQHQQNEKDKQPVLIALSEAHHPAAHGAAAYSSPRHMQHHQQHPHMQQSKPGSITQGYPVQQSNPNVQNPNMYPNRHRY